MLANVGSRYPPLAALTFAAQSVICAFGLASAAPRSPYRYLVRIMRYCLKKALRGVERKSSLRKEGRPAHHVGGLVKKSEELLGPDYESNLVRSLHSKTEKPEIPVSVTADFCGINRSSIYYSGKPVSDTELERKKIID